MRQTILHLICGLPGSGKSTLAAKLENQCSALRLNPDQWITEIGASHDDTKMRSAVESLQWRVAERALILGLDVILEFGFWSRAERARFREYARAIGSKVKIHFLDVPVPELKRRMMLRNSEGSFQVPPEKIDEWASTFEPPFPDELL